MLKPSLLLVAVGLLCTLVAIRAKATDVSVHQTAVLTTTAPPSVTPPQQHRPD